MKKNKIIAIITTVIITTSLIPSQFSINSVKAAETNSKGIFEKLEDDPDVRFAVISDIHVTPNKTTEQERFANVFSTIKKLDDNMDALAIVGDLTDSGTKPEYDTLKSIIEGNKPENLKLIASAGNHEGDSEELFTETTGNETRQNIEINGYHFITLSPRRSDTVFGGNRYNLDEEWLKEQLDSAVAEDPSKPIFVFMHHGIKDTAYGTDDWNTPDLGDLLDDYPQVVHFSGHSHYPLNDPRSIDQEDFTAINTCTTSYFELESGMKYGTIPPNANNAYQMMVLDVNGTEVKIRKLDLLSGEYIGEDWVIDTAKGKEGFTYTDDRANTSKLPYFEEDDKVEVSEIDENGCKLTIDQAAIEDPQGDNNDEIVHSYRFDFINKATGEIEKSDKIWSEFYFKPMPESLTQDFSGLKSGTEYEVKVTALNAYGLESTNVITTTFKTLEGFVIPTDEELKNIEIQDPNMLDVDFTNSAEDSSQTDNSMNVIGNPEIIFDETLNKNVAKFNGGSAYQYQFDDNKYSNMKQSVTMSCTFKVDKLNGTQDVFANTQSAGISYELSKIDGDDNHIRAEFWIRIENNGSHSYKIVSANIPVGEYVNLTSTYDGKKIRFYVNGLIADSVNAEGSIKFPSGNSQKFCIGADVNTEGNIEYTCSNTNISSAKLYSSVLDASQIYKLYKEEVSKRENIVEEKAVKSLASTEKYIKVNIEEGIDLNTVLSQIKFKAIYEDGTEEIVSLKDCSYDLEKASWIKVENNKIYVTEKGLHELEVTKGEAKAKLTVLSKATDESEYVLYEEDFNDLENGTLPSGWSTVQVSGEDAIVSEGAFVLNGCLGDNYSPARVILPDTLNQFGNYKVSADITMLQANNNSRWCSLAYRVQDGINNNQYYQMAVRQNATATNGVEFAQRTPSNTWNVMNTASYKESLSVNKSYKFETRIYGDRVQELIDDELLIDSNTANEYKFGSIGFHAAGCKMKIDNIKVVLQENELENIEIDNKYVDVQEITDNISVAPTSIVSIENVDDLSSIVDNETLPANVLISIDDNLNVVNSEGNIITTLDSVISKIDNKIIPVINVYSTKAATNLVNYLKENEILDVTVMSDIPEVINQIRTDYSIVRGVLKFNDTEVLSDERLMEILKITNSSKAKVAYINPELINNDVVEYLQKRLISVWSNVENESVSEVIRLANTGVNGIITTDFNDLVSAYNMYDSNTLLREPLVIGHRGTPALAPENTLEGSLLAYENGANVIENDIYLTKDGEIVIMHDGNLDRTTTGTGAIENYTLEELKQFYANKQFPNEYPNAKIPTLREYFEAFKDKDMVHFVEIKSSNKKIVDALNKLITEMGVEDQVVVISFNAEQLKRMNEIMPWVSVGFLNGVKGTVDNETALNNIFNATQSMNATYNPSYGCIDEKILEELKHRGMTIWPWTYRNQDLFKNHFLMGIYGLTTDYSYWAKDLVCDVLPESTEYILDLEESIDLKATGNTYGREVKDLEVEIVEVDNNEVISVEDNKVTALKVGQAKVMLKTKVLMDDSRYYTLYSDIININVEDLAEDLVIEDLSANIESPQKLGETIKINTKSTGGEGTIKYKYYIAKDGKEVYSTGYRSKNSISWTPKDDGKYTIAVSAKDEKGNKVSKSIQYVINEELKINSYKLNKNNSNINLSIDATGEGSLMYKFEITKDGNVEYLREFSVKNNTTWEPNDSGKYYINYIVKDSNGNEVKKTTIYEIDKPIIVEKFGVQEGTTVEKGSTLNLYNKAIGQGDLSYRFVALKDGLPVYVRGYKSSNVAKWVPEEAGTYTLYFKVKDNNGNEVSQIKEVRVK